MTARERRTNLGRAPEVDSLQEAFHGLQEGDTGPPKSRQAYDRAPNQVFDPARANKLAWRIEFHSMGEHGSWLNIAEFELSAKTRVCLCRTRIGDWDILRSEVCPWPTDLNASQRGVDSRLKIDVARRKLKSVCLTIMSRIVLTAH